MYLLGQTICYNILGGYYKALELLFKDYYNELFYNYYCLGF